ncbi:MAG: hypothetical protein QXX30_02220 [Candidatus Aenigmatarchaeota archaeon]
MWLKPDDVLTVEKFKEFLLEHINSADPHPHIREKILEHINNLDAHGILSALNRNLVEHEKDDNAHPELNQELLNIILSHDSDPNAHSELFEKIYQLLFNFIKLHIEDANAHESINNLVGTIYFSNEFPDNKPVGFLFLNLNDMNIYLKTINGWKLAFEKVE